MSKKSILVCVIAIIFLSIFGYPVGYFVLNENESAKIDIKEPNPDMIKGLGVYLINLDRSQDRLEYVRDNILKLGFGLNRISAVDGRLLSKEEINNVIDIEKYKRAIGYTPKVGMIGCNLSHIKTWTTFLNSNFEFALILEDDVSFDSKRMKNTINNIITNPKLWDIATFDIGRSGIPLTIKEFNDNQRIVVYLGEVLKTGAYLVNRAAARALLSKAYPLRMPIDLYFTRSWEFDLKFVGVENPRLVNQTFGYSETQNSEQHSDEKLTLTEQFKRRIMLIQSETIRFLYNLKIWIMNFVQN